MVVMGVYIGITSLKVNLAKGQYLLQYTLAQKVPSNDFFFPIDIPTYALSDLWLGIFIQYCLEKK